MSDNLNCRWHNQIYLWFGHFSRVSPCFWHLASLTFLWTLLRDRSQAEQPQERFWNLYGKGKQNARSTRKEKQNGRVRIYEWTDDDTKGVTNGFISLYWHLEGLQSSSQLLILQLIFLNLYGDNLVWKGTFFVYFLKINLKRKPKPNPQSLHFTFWSLHFACWKTKECFNLSDEYFRLFYNMKFHVEVSQNVF